MSVYYLPKLSELTDKIELRKEIKQGYKIVMPIVLIVSVAIFLLKDFIIWLLFTEEFAPMQELFLWQLVGGVIKVSALLLSYLMLAKSMTKAFVSTEIVSSISFVALSIWFVGQYGLIGMTYSFTVNYSLYLIALFILTRRELY